MKRVSIFALIALTSLVLSACGAAAPLAGNVQRAEPSFEMVEGESMEVPAEESMPQRDAAGQASSAPTVSERLVIRDANLSIVVEDPAQSVEEISRMAEQMGGFVVSSNVTQTTYGDSQLREPLTAKRASITIRVPSKRLDQALTDIKSDALEVRSQNVSGQDVTEEYTDLQSRLRNLEAAEEQLREILDQAEETEDVLRVFDELRRVREEIEIVRGRIQFLEESARLSSISVELIPDVASQPLQIGRWAPQGTAREALEALINTLQVIVDAAIWGLICVLPIALLLALPGYFVGRAILRRRTQDQEEPDNGPAGGEAS